MFGTRYFHPIEVGTRSDNLNTIGTRTYALNASATWYAVSFVAPPAGPTLSKVLMYVSAVNGTLTAGALECHVYSDAAGVPGSSLASTTTVTAKPTGAGWVEFTGFSYALTGGTQYWLVIKSTEAVPATNYATFRVVAYITRVYNAVGSMLSVATVNSGTAWATDSRTQVGTTRLEFSNGAFMGYPLYDGTTGSTSYGVYGNREYGVVFHTPAGGRFNLSGVTANVRVHGSPGSGIQFRLYKGVTLVATSKTVLVANIQSTQTTFAYFDSAQTLDPDSDYRIVLKHSGAAGDSSNCYSLGYGNLHDANASRALLPLGGWTQTSTADATAGPISFSDANTIVPLMSLLLDGESPMATPDFPSVTNVTTDDTVDGVTGTFAVPAITDVKSGTSYGAGGTEYTGTLIEGIPTGDIVAAQYVLTGHDNYTGGSAGTLTLPAVGDVQDGVVYGAAGTGSEGTFAVPAEADVAETVQYGAGGTEFTGTLVSGGDWTATEKAQIRYRLGIDGTESTPTNTPQLGSIGSDWTDTEKSHIRYRLGIDGTEAAPTNTPTLGTLAANVTQWNGANVATPNVSGVPRVDLTHVNGTAATGASTVDANVVQVSGDATAADNLEAAYDGTGYAGGTIKQKVDLDTIKTQSVTCAAGVTIRSNVGAAAAPGTANGMFIVGTNSGAVSIVNNAGDALLLQSTGGNGQGLSLVGNGVGSGLKASSGATAGTAAIHVAGMEGISVNAVAGNGMTVIGTTGDIVADITGNVSGSVGSVTNGVTLANGAHGGSAASVQFGAGVRVDSSADAGVLIEGATHAVHLKSNGGLVDWDVYMETNGNSQLTGTDTTVNTIYGMVGDVVGYVDCLPATWVTVPTAAQIKTALEADGSKLDVLYDDWLNGGRLDLLLDAIKAKTDVGLSNTTWTDAKAGYIDAAISSRGTGVALDAAGVRSALGLSAADLDNQLDTLATADALSAISTDVTRMAPLLVGVVSGAGTGTEVYEYNGVTVTVSATDVGNVTAVVFS